MGYEVLYALINPFYEVDYSSLVYLLLLFSTRLSCIGYLFSVLTISKCCSISIFYILAYLMPPFSSGPLSVSWYQWSPVSESLSSSQVISSLCDHSNHIEFMCLSIFSSLSETETNNFGTENYLSRPRLN